MKTLKNINSLYKLILVFAMAGFASSCVEENIDGFIPQTPEMIVGNSDVIAVAKDTATYEIEITSNLPWRIKTNTDWIVLKVQSGLGTGKAVFSVAKNLKTEEREGKIIAWITADYQKEIIVRQEAGDPLPDTSISYYVKVNGDPSNDGLSWESPITLDKALELAVSNDKIHIAAGTYAPGLTVTGGKNTDTGDKTFEIKNNISLIGAYPADAVTGSAPDNESHVTTLSGVVDGGNAYHVITVTAPIEEGRKVLIQGISITGGKAGVSGTAALSINGLNYARVNGGGVSIGRSVVELTKCRIHDNESMLHTPGVYIFGNANVTFDYCTIEDNKGLSTGGNGGALWNDGSTVYVRNSVISNNENTGVGGGIYAFNASVPSTTYIYNTTISNNKTSFRTGIYGRENSRTVMVNSTVYGNVATHATQTGAGICLYAGTTNVSLDMISCTITGNISAGTADKGGGVRIHDVNCTLNIDNSIISGNIVANGEAGDLHVPAALSYHKSYSVIADKVYDASGNQVAEKTFNVETMLDVPADNGGATRTCKLLLSDAENPARTLGMNRDQLSTLGAQMNPPVLESVISFDQIGNSRSGKTMIGACVK